MRAVSVIIMIFMLFSFVAPSKVICSAEDGIYPDSEYIISLANDIIEWKIKSLSDNDDSLYKKISQNAGSTASDWYAFSLGRFGYLEDSDHYTDHLKLYTEEKYKEKDKFSPYLSTEWHRIALTALSLGNDAKCFGKDPEGKAIDLINDGVYNRGLTANLGAQGISGYVWALISIDSVRYEVPDGAMIAREGIIEEILKRQLADGGFALTGKVSDPDVTSMVITALSPYMHTDKVYEYTNTASGEKRSSTVGTVIREAVKAISIMQTDRGEFRSYGVENVKSACQVTVALCSVGIDIFSDERFIKNGEDLLDVILRYKNTDGGFLNYIKDGAESNSMSGEQVLYTLNAILRFINGDRRLFDLRAEFSEKMKDRIALVRSGISALSDTSSYDAVYSLVEKYCALPKDERDYIYSCEKLYEKAKSMGISVEEIDKKTEKLPDLPIEDNTGNEDTVLTDEDISFIKYISKKLPDSTEYYQKLLILKRKIEDAPELEGRAEILGTVNNAIEYVCSIQIKIDSINKGIRDIAYPLDAVNESHKEAIYELMKKYESLSLYDKEKIEDYEALLSAYAKADTEQRSGMVLYVSLGAILILTLFVALNIRRRYIRKKKKEEEYCE